ncbi:hypothetical protein DFJ58DRAFT_134506 [Suillus subalutaceus]|uniref:uncharacterized protein n=1 Tax=Suillus subalutaceus TaxID=48586 RepID=UPI001B86075F|nr:uncharacterized protein DFJ58DRAFT_134506 [Suillus subalutaceus]KAG1838029.1 hypothetical protein DFJ58DRAFT_134506 [Suillus subalutaceus]
MAFFACVSDLRGSVIFLQLLTVAPRPERERSHAQHDASWYTTISGAIPAQSGTHPMAGPCILFSAVDDLLHLQNKHSSNNKANHKANHKAKPISRRHHSKLVLLLHRCPRHLLLLLRVLPYQEQQPRSHDFLCCELVSSFFLCSISPSHH